MLLCIESLKSIDNTENWALMDSLSIVCLEKKCNILFHICCILAMRSSIENGIGRSKEREWLISVSAGSQELYEVVTVKPIQFLPTFANSAFPNGRSL